MGSPNKKQSDYIPKQTIASPAFITFFENKTNFSISFDNFLLSIGATGNIIQLGNQKSPQTLDKVGNTFGIRAMESGPGIKSELSALNGITHSLNLSQSSTGIKLIDNLTVNAPKLKTLEGSANVTLTDTEDTITISAFLGAGLNRDGLIDYHDLATASTPISVTGGAGFTKLTNDGLDTETNKNFKPTGVTELWDVAISKFDFSGLVLGDQIDIVIDIEITTTVVNQEVDIELLLGDGGTNYTLPVETIEKSVTGVLKASPYYSFYMRDANTLSNTGQIGVKSSDDCSVKINNFYIRVIRFNA